MPPFRQQTGIYKKNLQLFGEKMLECSLCGSIFNNPDCEEHDIYTIPFNHMRAKGIWYKLKEKYIYAFFSLIEAEELLLICGSLDRPQPKAINCLTDLFTAFRKHGATEEEMERFFPGRVERMRGRVLKELVKPPRQRR